MRRPIPAWIGLLVGCAAPLVVGALLAQFAGTEDQTNVAFALLLVVIAAAAYGGQTAGVCAAMAGFLTFNFVFIEPVLTLTVATRRDFGVLIGFLTVSLVVSSLVARIESQRHRAEDEARDAQLLFDLNVSLADPSEPGAEMRDVAELAQESLGFRAVAVIRSDRVDDVLHSAGVPEPVLRLAIAGGAGNAVVAAAPLRQGGRLLLIGYSDSRVNERQSGLLVAFAARAAASAERRAAADERARIAVLQETDRQRSALLSSVSHDLRTPLASIKVSASALRTSTTYEDRRELATSIVAEVDRLDRMVRNLLDLSRVERGILVANRELVPVDDLVGSVLTRLRPAIGRRELIVDVPNEIPEVLVDFVQVEQALTNLVENTVLHTPPESGLFVTAREHAGRVTVRVADNGPGIAADERERIFRRFERGRSAGSGGSGLGLAIARAFAEASGGHVELADSPIGTAFDLVLPTNAEPR